MKNLRLKNILRIFYVFIIIIISAIAILTLLSAFGIPKSAQIFAVETGSMEPNVPTGSLVFVSPQTDYQVGDIITYRSNLGKPEAKTYNVTHRIAGISTDSGDTFYETKGDANAGPDPWTANKLDVIGKVSTHIPYLGYVVSFAKTKPGFILLILTPALIIIVLEVLNIATIIKEPDSKNQKRLQAVRGLYLDL